MQSTKPLDKNIQFLISANYQRMITFEQAAFLTTEQSFKEFYLEKADESEINIQQLYLMLDANNSGGWQNAGMPNVNSDTFLSTMFHGKKSTLKILESVKIIEKNIVKWYKSTLKEIIDLPVEVTGLIEQQYKSLNHAQLQLECL
ncbi:MAG: hypothetical protein ABJB86_07220 [Bacteroidota bacterium]